MIGGTLTCLYDFSRTSLPFRWRTSVRLQDHSTRRGDLGLGSSGGRLGRGWRQVLRELPCHHKGDRRPDRFHQRRGPSICVRSGAGSSALDEKRRVSQRTLLMIGSLFNSTPSMRSAPRSPALTAPWSSPPDRAPCA